MRILDSQFPAILEQRRQQAIDDCFDEIERHFQDILDNNEGCIDFDDAFAELLHERNEAGDWLPVSTDALKRILRRRYPESFFNPI